MALAIHRRSEMLLYMASRAQLVEEVIRPGLAGGKTVISDRYLLANVVYQGHAGGLDPADVWGRGRNHGWWIDAGPRVCSRHAGRAGGGAIQRAADRMEAQGLTYLEAVRQGFLAEAKKQQEKIVVLDADRPAEAVHADVMREIDCVRWQEAGASGKWSSQGGHWELVDDP